MKFKSKLEEYPEYIGLYFMLSNMGLFVLTAMLTMKMEIVFLMGVFVGMFHSLYYLNRIGKGD